jgi:hypothetical protein
MVEPDTVQTTIWRLGIACCIPKAIDTHSEHVILTDFPLQQLLHERASLLRYTYSVCLVKILLMVSLSQMRLRSFGCADICSVIKQIPHLEWNRNSTHDVTNSLALRPILSLNMTHGNTSYCFAIHFNIAFPSTHRKARIVQLL